MNNEAHENANPPATASPLTDDRAQAVVREQVKEPSKPEKQQQRRRLFHYTTASNFAKILADRAIKPTALLLEQREKPAVWFSYHPQWEPTATPAFEGELLSSLEEIATVDTPVRIEVPESSAPLTWRWWRKRSGVRPRIATALENSAIKQKASVHQWRVSFDPVADDSWIAVELYHDGVWRQVRHNGQARYAWRKMASGTGTAI